MITSDAPSCSETVIDGENSFLLQPKSVNELATAMEKLIQNPEQIKAMGDVSL